MGTVENVIYVTDKSAELLSQLVDMALRAQGVNALNLVNQLVLKHIKDLPKEVVPTPIESIAE